MQKNLENLEIFDLDGNFLEIKKRDKYYEEIKKEFSETGKISKKVKTIKLFLLNSSGEIYVQKRSKQKNENSGLFDKTVGGHVISGHSFDFSVVKECLEELDIPITILPKNDFKKILNLDLEKIGVFQQVELVENFISIRKSINGEIFEQPLKNLFYIGYYDGIVKCKDQEASGIELIELQDLKKDILKNPELFTEDLKFMLQRYEKFLVPIKKS